MVTGQFEMNEDQKKRVAGLDPTDCEEQSVGTFAEKLGIEKHQLRLIFGSTRVDYGQTKEQINRDKHGYSLESAAYLLQRRLLPVPQPQLAYRGPVQRNGEYRYELMTLDDDEHTVLFFVVTMRPNEIV